MNRKHILSLGVFGFECEHAGNGLSPGEAEDRAKTILDITFLRNAESGKIYASFA